MPDVSSVYKLLIRCTVIVFSRSFLLEIEAFYCFFFPPHTALKFQSNQGTDIFNV